MRKDHATGPYAPQSLMDATRQVFLKSVTGRSALKPAQQVSRHPFAFGLVENLVVEAIVELHDAVACSERLVDRPGALAGNPRIAPSSSTSVRAGIGL